MKQIAILLLVWTCCGSLNAQSSETDTLDFNRFRFSVGYDVVYFFADVFGRNDFGPVHADAHYFPGRSHFGIGFNFDYTGANTSYDELYDWEINDPKTAYYQGRLRTSQYLIEGMYYLDVPGATGKLLNKWRLYGTIGLGLGVLNDNQTLTGETTVNAAPRNLRMQNYYFAQQYAVGAERRFGKHLGMYVEAGYGISNFQFGAWYKL